MRGSTAEFEAHMRLTGLFGGEERMIGNCPKCGYEWESRVAEPKACPRCKSRLDYRREGNTEGDKDA